MLPNLLGDKLLTGVLPLTTQEITESWLPSQSPIMDIESCIDNPSLAPLGGHIRLVSDKSKRRGKHSKINNDGQVKIRRKHDLRHKDIYGAGLLMLRRKNLTTDELAQQLNAKAPPLPLASFLNQQQLLLQHNHWFDGLVELNISRNKLTSLPTEITSLIHLRTLNASSNLLTHLPAELYHLTCLKVLNLSENDLHTIPDEMPLQLPSLVTLSVAGNSIDYLTHNINQWIHLRHLQLGSVFGGNRLTQLPETIGDMACLEELELSCNQLRALPATMCLPSLINLNVSRNQLDSLPSCIGDCLALKTLNVSKNHLTSLPATLVNLDNLELLDVSENLLCIMPADILERMKGTLMITGNPLTRPGHCDASDDAYAQVLKQMAMRALPMMSSPSSSSSSSIPAPSNTHQCGPQGNGCLSSRLQSPPIARSIHQSSQEDTSAQTATHIIPPPITLPASPSSSSPENHYEFDTDDDSILDRELTLLAQQLNVHGARKNRQQPFISHLSVSRGEQLQQQQDDTSLSIAFTEITQPTTPSLSSVSSSATTSPETPIQYNQFSRSLLVEVVEASLGDTNDEAITCSTVDTTTLASATLTTNMVHSLRELATRVILQSDNLKVPLHQIPPHLVHDLSNRCRRRWCAKCQLPFVNEWLTSVQVKSYGGHPAVVHRIRFCSTRCWKLYLHGQSSSVVCVHQPDTQPILQDCPEDSSSLVMET